MLLTCLLKNGVMIMFGAMNGQISFNKKLFTSNVTDYKLIKELKGDLLQAEFIPLKAVCVVRQIRLVDYDLQCLENENDIDKLVCHKNVLNMLHSFVDCDHLYTIYPYAELGSIGDICKPFGLDEQIISVILEDVINGVHYLHSNNIVHRAIKASHILVFGNGKTCPLRFVLSGLQYSFHVEIINDLKLFDYPKNAQNLLNHLAPEVLEQNILGYNFKADIYSLGIVCCELANGVVPFDNMSPDEILFYKIIGDIPKLLDSSCQEMLLFKQHLDRLEMSLNRRYQIYMKRQFSKSFQQFTARCLHLEPVQRPTANDLLNDCFIKKTVRQKEQSIERFLSRLNLFESSNVHK